MSQKKSLIIYQQLSQIVDMLILNGTLTECPGLVHGKMGIAIFFFHYAQYTKNTLFADYAFDLIEEIQNQIHANSSADYEKGIAGIGVGIDYLVQNSFLITEEDICEDLDQRMVRAVLYDPWQDFSLYNGLTGYGRYWISRFRHKSSFALAWKCLSHIVEKIAESLPNISREELFDIYCFLHNLQKLSGFEHCMTFFQKEQKWNSQIMGINNFCSRLENSVLGEAVWAFQCNWYLKKGVQTKNNNILKQFIHSNMREAPTTMGLLNGYAGQGLLRLGAVSDINPSWMLLL